MANKGSAISAENDSLRLENKYYKRFLKQKEKIKEKYPEDLWFRPSGSKNTLNKNYNNHHLWKEYIKEVSDLMWEPNGWYQQFVWDCISESEKIIMRRRATSNKKGAKY